MLFFCYNDKGRLDRKEVRKMSFKDFNFKDYIQEALDEIKLRSQHLFSKN